jgi:guanylate kinase
MNNIVIISGPAGSGKDVVIEKLKSLLPIERIITTTTRTPRPGEREGDPYYFLSREAFEQGIARGDFVEYSVNENNEWYGVTKTELERATNHQALALWRVDWKGVVSIKKLYPEIPAIYISAPLAVLEARLRARDIGRDEAYFTERMAYTREWQNHLDIYDYVVENEEGKLDQAVEKVRFILEQHH